MKKKYFLIILLFCSILINCSKSEDPILSEENKIISFDLSFNGETYIGQINESSKTINIETIGLELTTSIIPQIEISANATISPSISIAQDFKQEVQYTITAENGNKATYRIIANNTILLSGEKKILSYSFEYDNEIYKGIIDHDKLTIDVETNFGVIGAAFSITVSEGATYTFSPGNYQNFHLPITYTVIAEDGTSNDYIMTPKICEFSPRFYIFYSNASPLIGGFNIDLTIPNSALVLENDTHSYTLTYSDYNVNPSTEIVGVSGNFRVHFPANIVSANNYKLRYKVNNEIKAEADRNVDILAENLPIISDSNQDIYKHGDTMILSGNNLVPGLLVDAYNGSDYLYYPPYVDVNTQKTELTFPMTNRMMFPSYYGEAENYPTRVYIYHNGREGDSIIVDFD